MTRTVATYVENANAKFEAGFTTKAAQKDALDDLNRAYAMLRKDIQGLCLKVAHEDRTEAQNALYWGLPDLHNWKPKHTAAAVAVFPETQGTCTQIESLAELRLAIKASEIVRVERKADERVERVLKSIRELMELRGTQYETGLKLCEIFGQLPVSASAHYVTNQFGTTFLRTFFYMNGKLTPLNLIMAVLQEDARRKEEAEASNRPS